MVEEKVLGLLLESQVLLPHILPNLLSEIIHLYYQINEARTVQIRDVDTSANLCKMRFWKIGQLTGPKQEIDLWGASHHRKVWFAQNWFLM